LKNNRNKNFDLFSTNSALRKRDVAHRGGDCKETLQKFDKPGMTFDDRSVGGD
jgi:hypothetical protein